MSQETHIIRSQLTQTIPLLAPEIYDEMVMACNEFIPYSKGNRPNPGTCLKAKLTIVKQSGRVFVPRTQ